MRLHFVAIASLTLLAAGWSRPLAAQSLADLSRQEEERRKAVKTPAKVITNKDLGVVSAGSPAPVPPPAASSPPEGGKAVDRTTQTDTDPAKDSKDPAKDQAYWLGRLKDLQTQLDRDQTYSEALQTRINSLSADFVNRDDPAQRGVIERDRQKAVAELDRLKGAVQADQKAIADFEEEARRAGVPPGWLR